MLSRTKAGLILQAIRDQEGRVQYFGYDVAVYKITVMAISAAIAGLAGMLYTIVMEFASPTFLNVPLSLSVVIWCAVGGGGSLPGAFFGAVLVTGVQGALSEIDDLPRNVDPGDGRSCSCWSCSSCPRPRRPRQPGCGEGSGPAQPRADEEVE